MWHNHGISKRKNVECKVVIVSTQEQNPKTDPNYGTRDFSKVIYSKYYKHLACALAHEMRSVCFSLFWHKKVHFKVKIDSFLNQLFRADTTMHCNVCTESPILYLFWPIKILKTLTAQSAKKTAKVQDSVHDLQSTFLYLYIYLYLLTTLKMNKCQRVYHVKKFEF